jgi:diadenosine tetraphosphate (Ap4A) HIT family hydrolase
MMYTRSAYPNWYDTVEREVAGGACYLCRRAEQPAALFETPTLYVMPHTAPLQPGHVVIVSKMHVRCYADAPDVALRDLDIAIDIVQRFLTDVYGYPAFGQENGAVGWAVYHAHLNLLPLPTSQLPANLLNHVDVVATDSWEPVRALYTRDACYRYVYFAGERRLMPGHGAASGALVAWLKTVTGLRRTPKTLDGWVRTTTIDDVRDVERRWAAYDIARSDINPVSGA